MIEPSLLIAGVNGLISVVGFLKGQFSSRSARRRELELFEKILGVILRTLKEKLDRMKASSVKFTPESFARLTEKMKEFEGKARELRRKENLLTIDEVRSLREDVITTFNIQMAETRDAEIEHLTAKLEELMAREQRPQVLQNICIYVQGWVNPEVQEAITLYCNEQHPTKGVREYLINDKCNYLSEAMLAPEWPSTPEHPIIVPDPEDQRLPQLPAEQSRRRREEEEAARKLREEEQKKAENKLNNPNHSMRFKEDSDQKTGSRLSLSTRGDGEGRIDVTFEASQPKCMKRAMVGASPMKVSKKLGYFYFEVELVEIEELRLGGHDVPCGRTGVGIGLVVGDKFRDDEMVGSYKHSTGYNGCSGDVNCGQLAPREPSNIGKLEKGDTLGIGLLALPAMKKPVVFFRKNGQLRQGTHKLSDIRGGVAADVLYPVVAIASPSAKLHVNFHGPFNLPSGADLAAMLNLS